MRLRFIRHAESEANVLGGLHCSAPGPGLSPYGFEQAEALAVALAGTDIRGVYASTMLRSAQSAAPVATRLGLEVVVLPGLHETHLGDLDCRVDDEAHQIFDELFAAWMLDDALDRARPGGETGAQVLDRMRASIDDVLDRHTGDGEVVLIGHGAALRLTLSRILAGVSPDFALRHHLANTEAVLVEVEPVVGERPRLVCRDWAGLPPQD